MSEPVVLAILAKDKAHVLPLFLECILQQTFPKQYTHLYIRTNDNNDDTELVLRTFTTAYGSQYASVFFDASSVSDSLLKYEQHEWCEERFIALAAIRQESVNYAARMNANYFVCDCDNFITKDCLMQLYYGARALGGVVGPFLRCGTQYSNYHFTVDSDGYFVPSTMYDDVWSQKIKGIIEVAVIHCTYFIPASVTGAVKYSDGTSRHEYVIFSDVLRRQGIPQFLDTRKVYGYLTFATCLQDFQKEFQHLSRAYLTIEPAGPTFPFSTTRLPSLIVSPQAGFGNRMRAMCGALLLAERSNPLTLAHCWYASDSEHTNSRIQNVADLGFEYFFEPSAQIPSLPVFENNCLGKPCVAYTEWMPGQSWYRYQSNAQRRFNANTFLAAASIVHKTWSEDKADGEQPCILETSHNVMVPYATPADSSAVYKKHFLPRFRFRNQIACMKGVVGCSIRVGQDFQDFFPTTLSSAEKLQTLVCALDVPVVVFSDDRELRDTVRGGLKHAFVPTFESDGTISDADTAFLEFLTLAACDVIYGTVHSSFSTEAAVFGNIKYIAL